MHRFIYVGPYPTFYAIYKDDAGELYRYHLEAMSAHYFNPDQFFRDIKHLQREVFILRYDWVTESDDHRTLWVRYAAVQLFKNDYDIEDQTFVRWENHDA